MVFNERAIMEFLKQLKDHAASITAVFSMIGAVGGTLVYVETNYANAADVNQIILNQQQQIRLQESSQRANAMFQLEYYDDRIARLNAEKRKAEEIYNSRNQQLRSTVRPPPEIQSDIDDIKNRRDLTKRVITTP